MPEAEEMTGVWRTLLSEEHRYCIIHQVLSIDQIKNDGKENA